MLAVHFIGIMIFCMVGFVMVLYTLFDGDEAIGGIGGILFIIGLVLLIFYCVGEDKCKNAEWEYNDTPYAVERIAALNDNNMMNGKFYMRRGYIESDLYYQYLVKLNNGGFKSNKVKSDAATIFYDDDDYRVEWYTKTRSWLYWTESETYFEIYIPEGSLTDDYSIDLR